MKKIFLLFVILLSLTVLHAQTSEVFCGFNSDVGLNKNEALNSISTVPHSGTFRILIVLCKFIDDNYELPPLTNGWTSDINEMPSWGPEIVSPVVSPSYPNPSISGYFDIMSSHNYDVIGNVYFYQPADSQYKYFISSGRHIGYLVEEILSDLDVNQGVNFANYDNDNDGTVDMIFVCFRAADFLQLDGNSYQGIAGLTGFTRSFGSGSTLSFDGKTISSGWLGSGIIQKDVYDLHGALGVSVHEFGHYLFGTIHYEGVGYHGLMDGEGSGVMSSFERERLGWITPQIISANRLAEPITDAVSTNDVYRIQIPGSSGYFLIDNHLRQNYYESSWRKYLSGPLISPGTGIMISHCTSSSIDVESAFGKWNWRKSGGLYVFPFETDTPNRHSGEDKLNLRDKNTTTGIQNHPDYLGSQDDFFSTTYNRVFAPWSNPSSSINASNSTNISVVIKGTTSIDYYVNDITITESTTFPAETFTFNHNLIVMNGITLTLNAGTTLNFTGGASLIVNGTLQANGNSTNQITFSSPSKGSWGGIRFNQNSTGVLSNCTIRNATNGIFIDNASPNISYCFIDDADNVGVYIQNYNAWPEIWQNYIESDFACIAHYNSGNGFIHHNSLRNAQYGVYVSSGSPRYDFYDMGRNKFETSILQDRVKISTGQPWLGKYQYFTQPGSTTYKYIYNQGSSNINAVQNYWSANPPPFIYFYGSVDRSSPLSSPPSNPPAGPGWSLPKSSTEGFFAEFNKASYLFYNGNYKDAMESFKNLTDNNLDSSYSSYSLNWYMLSAAQLNEESNKLGYLQSIRENTLAHPDLIFYAIKWLLPLEIRSGKSENARNLIAEVEPGSKYERELSLDLAVALYELASDKVSAEDMLDKISSKFSDKNTLEAVAFIRDHFENFAPSESIAFRTNDNLEIVTNANKNIPLDFDLIGNYPNPFNPSTTIKYYLPKISNVELRIYDIMGKEIKSFQINTQTPGYQNIVWDGLNKNSEAVSSGIYIYWFAAKSLEDEKTFIKTSKLFLLK